MCTVEDTFDLDSTALLINFKCPKRYRKPFPINKGGTINPLPKSCTRGKMVVMQGLILSQFNKNCVVELQKVLVFEGK
jgi:hypothetical protein